MVGEFRQFVEFLQRIWAVLAGISALFPLSGTFTELIPLDRWPDGGFAYLLPSLVPTLGTLVSVFLILWIFGKRHQIQEPHNWDALPRKAGWSFAVGFVAIALYLVGHYAISHDFYYLVLGWESGDLRRIVGDLFLLFTYISFFALVTRAFLLLGLREYLREKAAAQE